MRLWRLKWIACGDKEPTLAKVDPVGRRCRGSNVKDAVYNEMGSTCSIKVIFFILQLKLSLIVDFVGKRSEDKMAITNSVDIYQESASAR